MPPFISKTPSRFPEDVGLPCRILLEDSASPVDNLEQVGEGVWAAEEGGEHPVPRAAAMPGWALAEWAEICLH